MNIMILWWFNGSSISRSSDLLLSKCDNEEKEEEENEDISKEKEIEKEKEMQKY